MQFRIGFIDKRLHIGHVEHVDTDENLQGWSLEDVEQIGSFAKRQLLEIV